MSDDDLPDVPRSPSGRVPKWVLDEARGEAPTELIPFRAEVAVLPQPPAPAKERNKPREWVTLLIVVAVILGAVGYTFTRQKPEAAPTKPVATSTPIVETIAGRPTPGQGEVGHPLGQPAPFAPTSDHYRFTNLQAGGTTPVTWSPCRPIHYVVRLDNQPIEGPRILTEGFTKLTQATGLVFINDGFTQEKPDFKRSAYQPVLYGDRWAPVLIAWATPDEVPDLDGDVTGAAGAQAVTGPSGSSTYVTGMVALDAADVTEIARTAGEPAAQAVALHELGHLVGLDHVSDNNQIMAPEGRRNGPVDYRAGDLTGLARLGSGPCRPDV